MEFAGALQLDHSIPQAALDLFPAALAALLNQANSQGRQRRSNENGRAEWIDPARAGGAFAIKDQNSNLAGADGCKTAF